MTQLHAAWLGSWKAPWPLGRGRRWGDPAWALAAIAQAWLLGGHEGRWPATIGSTRPSEGLRFLEGAPAHLSAPPAEWIALLRHGSAQLDPDQRGRAESDLVHACWQSLREGDGRPWMGLGTVLLDRPTRCRWIPLLGAVDPAGTLHLPPFLAPLIPEAMRRLPPGWWSFLLSRSDRSGALNAESEPAEEPDWGLLDPTLRPLLRPLVLRERPRGLTQRQTERWLVELDPDLWMVDPRLRAWARGDGLSAESLGALIPASLDLGDDLPPVSGLHRDRKEPEAVPSQTCADPYAWHSAGLRDLARHDYPAALGAFRWAHAHFTRLRRPEQAEMAAVRAAVAACRNGTLPEAARWRAMVHGSANALSPAEEAEWLLAQGDRRAAVDGLRRHLASASPPDGAVGLLLREALLEDHPDWISVPSLETTGEGRAELHPGLSLARELRHCQKGTGSPASFWTHWIACPDQPFRLETGLRLLEAFPGQRTSGRLLELQTLAQRSGVACHQRRVEALWPTASSAEPEPMAALDAWIQVRPFATWITWEAETGPMRRGKGSMPPESMFSALQTTHRVGPIDHEGSLWWGFALHWEGIRVGALLTVVDSQGILESPLPFQLIAPWVARLHACPRPTLQPEPGPLLTDGSEPMATLLGELDCVAPSLLPVLVLGPTGSGKELVAQEIHGRSKRKGPFIPVNCAEFSETLMESELFGHVRGAFTGADRDRKGAIEQAEGGTLFLDEVADLSPRLQSLFLRVLQEREIRRVGSERIHKINVRFLAATHRDLDQLVATGHFRKDLHYRLKGVVLKVPSLHERRHEFPFLIPRLAARVAREAGLECPDFSPGLISALSHYEWPGNIRELRHAIERALLKCKQGPLKATHFPELTAPSPSSLNWESATRAFQRSFLLSELRASDFQIAASAAKLGLTRQSLYVAARRLGVDLARERNERPSGEAMAQR